MMDHDETITGQHGGPTAPADVQPDLAQASDEELRQLIKSAMRWTGASERTVKYWFRGERAPSVSEARAGIGRNLGSYNSRRPNSSLGFSLARNMTLGGRIQPVGRSSTMDATSPILRPGDTCWRIPTANRLAVIVNAADYFTNFARSRRRRGTTSS